MNPWWHEIVIYHSLTVGRALEILQSGLVHFGASSWLGGLVLLGMWTISRKPCTYARACMPSWVADLFTCLSWLSSLFVASFVSGLVHVWLDGLLGVNDSGWLMGR